MDYNQTFAISAAGMTVERTRVEVASLNLANANTIQSADGPRYQPLRVIAQAVTAGVDPVGFQGLVERGLQVAPAGSIPAMNVVPSDVAPRRVYEPGHPMADARGFVSYAGVDTATEMIGLMEATRAYEANVVAMNTTKTMALKALEIGGN